MTQVRACFATLSRLACMLLLVACGDEPAAPDGGEDGRADADGGRLGDDGGGRRDDGDTTPAEDGSITPPALSCKRGIAYGHHSYADLTALSPAVSWWYNWAAQPDEALRDGSYSALGVEYVPMIWGRSFDAPLLIASIPEGADALLGFNEPNFGSQANISAADAAALWPQVQSVADARGLLLVSPAVNFCGGDCRDADPFHYLDEFLAACAGCRVDRIAFHIYVGCRAGPGREAQWLIDHVREYESRFSQPLWLTEFACTDAASFDEQVAFLLDAVEFLENDPRIERYAWFSGRFDGIPFVDLLGADGTLTPLGRAYVAAPANAGCVR
jgi:hypothetical protein